MAEVPAHRVVLKDYPDSVTILENLMMYADYASLKAARASIQSDFFEHQKWSGIHQALERCASEVSHAGLMNEIKDDTQPT